MASAVQISYCFLAEFLITKGLHHIDTHECQRNEQSLAFFLFDLGSLATFRNILTSQYTTFYKKKREPLDMNFQSELPDPSLALLYQLVGIYTPVEKTSCQVKIASCFPDSADPFGQLVGVTNANSFGRSSAPGNRIETPSSS